MANISAADMRFLDVTLQMTGGYCLDFSDRTFSGFFADAINYNIDHEDNFREGGSKGKRMRYWLRMTDDRTAAKLLKAIWDYRADMPSHAYADPDPPTLKPRFDGIVAKLEVGSGVAKTDAIDRFSADETLEELVAGIQRDVDAGRPETALDRLHTYCMKKLAHLLAQRDPSARPAATLNARLGQYLGTSRRDAKLHHPVSFKIMTGAIETFELFNSVRNDRSLAHDNTSIERSEAAFIFEAIVNVLRFIKATEGQSFERLPVAPAPAPSPLEIDDEIPF
jgi:hypothetical protein